MNKFWHAVYVSSRQEKKVDESLRNMGVECYLPLVKTLRNWSDRKKLVEFPLIPGYVFVRLTEQQRESVLQLRGVVNFVRVNGKVGRVYDKEIESMKQLVTLGYHLEAFPSAHKLKEGDEIKITSGPLKNLEGFIIEEKSEQFFEVCLEGIGINIRVKLPEGLLKKVSN